MAWSGSVGLLVLLFFASLGSALKCYYCSGYDPGQPETNLNNPHCTSANFDKRKVEKTKNFGDVCVKSILYTGSTQWVDRYATYESTTRAGRSVDASPLNASRSDLEEEGRGDGDKMSVVSPSRLSKRYTQNYEYFYCSKNFCNGALSVKFSVWSLAIPLAACLFLKLKEL